MKPLYEADENVKLLKPESMPLPTGDLVHIVHFFKPDANNQQVASMVSSFAENMAVSYILRVSAVNCADHRDLCARKGVKGASEIRAFIPDKEQSVQYTGKLAGNALKKWALQQIPSHVSVVNSEKDLQKLLEACSLNQSPGSSGAGAEWGACALLATDSSDVSALWKSISTRYRGKITLGQVHSSKIASLGLDNHVDVSMDGPTVIVLCNGDMDSAEAVVLPSERKGRVITQVLSEYKGGGACREEVKLSRDSLLRMKVKHLKALLVDKGLSCRECLEKNDFVSFLTAKLNLAASGHGTEL